MKKQTAGDSNKRKEVGAGKGENIIRSSIPFFCSVSLKNILRLARSRTERKNENVRGQADCSFYFYMIEKGLLQNSGRNQQEKFCAIQYHETTVAGTRHLPFYPSDISAEIVTL